MKKLFLIILYSLAAWPCWAGGELLQSTAATVTVGPIYNISNGLTTSGLTLDSTVVYLSANGAASGHRHSSDACTYDRNGLYRVPLDTTDTSQSGILVLSVAVNAQQLTYATTFVVRPSALAQEATLTAMKGGSWSTETLKAIKDAIPAAAPTPIAMITGQQVRDAMLLPPSATPTPVAGSIDQRLIDLGTAVSAIPTPIPVSAWPTPVPVSAFNNISRQDVADAMNITPLATPTPETGSMQKRVQDIATAVSALPTPVPVSAFPTPVPVSAFNNLSKQDVADSLVLAPAATPTPVAGSVYQRLIDLGTAVGLIPTATPVPVSAFNNLSAQDVANAMGLAPNATPTPLPTSVLGRIIALPTPVPASALAAVVPTPIAMITEQQVANALALAPAATPTPAAGSAYALLQAIPTATPSVSYIRSAVGLTTASLDAQLNRLLSRALTTANILAATVAGYDPGTVGASLVAAGNSGDPWAGLAADYATPGTFGYIIGRQSWLPLGSGDQVATYTLTNDTTHLPVAGAEVRVFTDAAMLNQVAVGLTNDFGKIYFRLNAGTYYLYRRKAGNFPFVNPKTWVVTENGQ